MEQELASLAANFKAHATQDESNFAAIAVKLDGLATKEDIADVLSFMKKMKTGENIIRWSWNNLAKIGSLGLTLIFIWGVFIGGFWGTVHNFFKLINGN